MGAVMRCLGVCSVLLLVVCMAACGTESGATVRDDAGERAPTSTNSPTEHLAFFNGLSGTLDIELTEAPVPVAPNLLNKKAPPAAMIKAVSLTWRLFLPDVEDFRSLTPEESNRVVLRQPTVRIAGQARIPVEHAAPDGQAFTVHDVAG